VGDSERMRKVYREIRQVAARRHPVLIIGESGTGKELVARAIHAQGPWYPQPFVPVDCGALTRTLIESELFGHVRGAFTGAAQSRLGLLAAAGKGTLFLDEVAELPLELQPKLLRALQEREIRPLGSNQRIPLEARIIAATNQDPGQAVKRGALRSDLYFRLNVVPIKLPPLRERKGDIPLLVRHFLARYGGKETGFECLSDQAMARLESYNWPGNVRELENCVQRTLALGVPPEIQVKDLPSNVLNYVADEAPSDRPTRLEELERQAILQALETADGDRLLAARLLGVSKTTIYRKLKEYGLPESPRRPASPPSP